MLKLAVVCSIGSESELSNGAINDILSVVVNDGNEIDVSDASEVSPVKFEPNERSSVVVSSGKESVVSKRPPYNLNISVEVNAGKERFVTAPQLKSTIPCAVCNDVKSMDVKFRIS